MPCEADYDDERVVSTHSRPKAAGSLAFIVTFPFDVSTHSRPKAAGIAAIYGAAITGSFNTQPPEGGWCGGLYG